MDQETKRFFAGVDHRTTEEIITGLKRASKKDPADVDMNEFKALEEAHRACDLDDDPVNPAKYMSYYKDGISCIEAMKHGLGENVAMDYCLGRAFCLIWANEDNLSIKKAIWYLNKYLELNK